MEFYLHKQEKLITPAHIEFTFDVLLNTDTELHKYVGNIKHPVYAKEIVKFLNKKFIDKEGKLKNSV